MTTRTFTFSVTAPSAPWYQGQQVNAWREIKGIDWSTKLSDQPTGAPELGRGEAKENAWCGWAIDRATSTVWSVGQGGHDDYRGNEVNRIRLADSVPAWSQVAPWSPQSVIPGTSREYYADGRPTSVHGYFTSVYVPSINRVVRFPGGSCSPGGAPSERPTAFNTLTNLYDPESSWPYPPPPISFVGIPANQQSICTNHADGRVYWRSANYSLLRWTPGVPGTWTQLLEFGPGNCRTTACDVIPVGDLRGGTQGSIYYLGGNAGAFNSHLYDIASNTFTAITLTGTDLSGVPVQMIYVPASAGANGGKFYACVNHGIYDKVYVITPAAGNTWSCAALNTGTSGDAIRKHDWLDGLNTGDLPYRFLYAPALGGCVYGPGWGSNLWFLKLH